MITLKASLRIYPTCSWRQLERILKREFGPILQGIPYGQTVTYGQIAQDLQVASAQAIGGAVGRNPWSILVPCHRVLGAGKRLTGYAAGVEKKAWLLEHEGVDFKDRNNRRRSTC